MEEAFWGAAWDASKHPREPGGTREGGQFRSLFHVSPVRHRQEIYEKGLLPDAPKRYSDSGPGVYTFGSRDEAWRFATTGERMYGDSDIWEVKNEGLDLQRDPFFEPGHPMSEQAIAQMGEKPDAFVTKQAIPPEMLTLHPNPWYPDLTHQARLVEEGIRSWVASPQTMRIHMAHEINGDDYPDGPAGRLRDQATALLHAVREGGANSKRLYRGAKSLTNELGVPESWSESRAVARKFAKDSGGEVFTLEPGTARGLKLGDREDQWLIDPLSYQMTAAGWDESQHPRDPGGEGGGQFIEKGTSGTDDVKMGLGSEEERAAAEAQWANIPDWTTREVQGRLREFMSEADLQMRVPEDALLEVLNDGKFMNQHESNAGRGMPRGVEQEARVFAVEAKPEALPKYGYLGPDNSQTNYYGPIRVVFNDSVKDRTTFTFDDSLIQNMGPVAPSPVRDPQLLSVNPSVAFSSDENFQTHVADLWYQVENELTPYAEAQIWGKLTPEDIAYVEIPDESYWDEEDPNTGLPLVNDREALEKAIAELERRGIRTATYTPEGDYSGEWA